MTPSRLSTAGLRINMRVWQQGRDVEADVRREMQPHNLLIEGRKDGKWELIG